MSLAYFPLYPTDFEADTAHLSLAEDGAYNRLLRLCWRTPGCSLPADREWIYRRMRAVSAEDQAVIDAVLDEFFTAKNDRILNARLVREWNAAKDAYEKRKNAGSKGGQRKALKTNQNSSSNATPMLKQPEPEPEPETTSVVRGAQTRSDLDELEVSLRAAAGLQNNPSPNLFDLSPILQLLEAGVDLERVIIPKIKAMAARGNLASVKSWRYFATAIANDIQSAPKHSLPPMSPTGEPWSVCLDAARKTRRWSLAWGPPPGNAGCKVPNELIEPGDGADWKMSGEAA